MKKHKILFTVILLLLLVLGACCLFVEHKLSLIDYNDGKLSDEAMAASGEMEPLDEEAEAQMKEATAGLEEKDAVASDDEIYSTKDVVNILLLGTDERAKSFSTNARADSIMILSINKTAKTIKLVSLERGMGFPILDGQYAGIYDWLTHCFRYGGADLMLREVRECLRVDVERYVRVNHTTFEQIIDSVGGVEIELNEREADYLRIGCKADCQTGLNLLDGRVALCYARLREIDDDWHRIQRQRNVIQAVVHASKGMTLPEINAAIDTVLPLVQTNLTQAEILNLATVAPFLVGADIEQMTIPKSGTYGSMKGLGGRSLFAVDFDANAQILREFLYGTAD